MAYKFHLFHRWGKWQIVPIRTVRIPAGTETTDDAQVRTCAICGYRQIEKLPQ